MKQRLELVLPAPLVSSWTFSGAVAASDGADGAAARVSAGAVAAQGGSPGAGAGGAATSAAATTAAQGGSARAHGVICTWYCC